MYKRFIKQIEYIFTKTYVFLTMYCFQQQIIVKINYFGHIWNNYD